MKKLLVTLMCIAMVLAMMPAMAFATSSVEAEINGVPYESLDSALKNAGEEDVIELKSDVNISSLLKVESKVTIDGKGHTVTATSAKAFEVYSDARFENITIKAKERCVDTRALVSLELENVVLEATGIGNTQPLTIGGNTAGEFVEVSIVKSKIDAGNSGYGIIFFNPVDMDIVDTSVEGYASLYFKSGSSNSVVNIKDSSVAKTENIHSGQTNEFGTIVFEEGGITINVDNSSVSAKSSGDQPQTVFFQSRNVDFTELKANTVNIYNGSYIVADTTKELATVSEKNNIVFKNATCNVEIPEAFIADGYKATKDATTGLWNVMCAGHSYVGGVCKVCGAPEPVVEVEKLPTVDATKPVEKVEVGTTEETKEVLAETSKKIVDAVINGEEVTNVPEEVVVAIQNALEQGMEVEVSTRVDVEVIDEKDIEDIIENTTIKLVEKTADGDKVVQYLDLSVEMSVSADGLVRVVSDISELTEKVTFTIAIPEELKKVEEGITREFYIIRVHNGEAERLEVKVNSDGTLSFETDRFSTYALAYKDVTDQIEAPKDPETPKDPEDPKNPETPKDPENPKEPETPKNPENPKEPTEFEKQPEVPKTGVGMNTIAWMLLMMLTGMGFIVFKKKEY